MSKTAESFLFSKLYCEKIASEFTVIANTLDVGVVMQQYADQQTAALYNKSVQLAIDKLIEKKVLQTHAHYLCTNTQECIDELKKLLK